jgi:diaminopimelate epimerase
MSIPFTKAHGSRNDFLLSWRSDVRVVDYPSAARRICDRHTGIGADGWMLIDPPAGDADGAIELYNSDGSRAEISGNGTRCAAAFLLEAGFGSETVRVVTGAGTKHLRVLERRGHVFEFEMNMGRPSYGGERGAVVLQLSAGPRQATVLDVGNPQCVLLVDSFELPWREIGREIESHAAFPNRTNVSFVRITDRHRIEARFYERGVGETMSSGTGSTGAACAALLTGKVEAPLDVLTPAGALRVRQEDGELYLTGPAEMIGAGEFYQE